MSDFFLHINDYLHYGYVPKFGKPTLINHILNPPAGLENFEEREEDDLVKEGITILKKVFDDLLKDKEDKKHIVPLSGGLDSRLIIAALMERVSHDQIKAVTFGSPGSFDYDLPSKVVKGTQIHLKKINCISLDYSMENLVSATRDGGEWTSTPDNYINRLSLEKEDGICRWSGFMGGEIAGSYSHLNKEDEDNYLRFAKYQQRSKAVKLTSENYDPVAALNRIFKVPYNLTEFEMLFLANRSAAGAIPIMYPEGKEILNPFLHPDWVNFIIRVPKNLRNDALLYNKIIYKMHPRIMTIPCKNNAGLGLHNNNQIDQFLNHVRLKFRFELSKVLQSIHYPPVGVNYLFYQVAIKEITSLNKSIEDACNSLEDRKIIPWISPRLILEEHLKGKIDHTNPLLILLGLEVNLRAQQ